MKKPSSNSSRAILHLPVEHVEDRCRTNQIIPVLSALDGVLSVHINHVTNMVTIEYDEKRVTIGQLRSKIRQTVVPTGNFTKRKPPP